MPKRNWPSILIDAGLRGLSATGLAKEIGLTNQAVRAQALRYAVRLEGMGTPSSSRWADKNAPAVRPTANAWLVEWPKEIEHAKATGETLNQFCLRVGVAQSTAEDRASRAGHVFPTTGAKTRGGQTDRWRSIADQAQPGDTPLSLAKRTRKSKQTVLKAAAHYGLALKTR